MKRIHLFEFEDLDWFPHWLRIRVTRFIVPLHRLMRTPAAITPLLQRALARSTSQSVFDLCSGSCGPMLHVMQKLWQQPGLAGTKLTFSDLYPQVEQADIIADQADERVTYLTTPVDATNPGDIAQGVRTMMCSLHHMPPDLARSIVKRAFDDRAPFLAFEISDNSMPRALWWLAIPNTFLMTLLLTPWIRPMTWQQLVFTYIIPIIPAVVAWDGAVSNARTYTQSDMDELLTGLHADDYTWEKGTVGGFGPARQLYLLGLPQR
ncbi:MAG: hypothetical protein KC502_07625 [Myxococcales bacterium]|nr:hypothetical protein [Myxococcales bacterium]